MNNHRSVSVPGIRVERHDGAEPPIYITWLDGQGNELGMRALEESHARYLGQALLAFGNHCLCEEHRTVVPETVFDELKASLDEPAERNEALADAAKKMRGR